jgi:hypothetical protein
MDITTAHVDYRREQLDDLSRSLRLERRRKREPWLRTVRVALGRRLVLAGVALLDGAGQPVAATR